MFKKLVFAHAASAFAFCYPAAANEVENTVRYLIEHKKGKTTDYVSRQYLGSIGKIERGIVTVNAYGIYEQITFPLIFKVFKPKRTLKAEDQFKTKIQLASEIITELVSFGFKIDLVLADSLYGKVARLFAL